MKTLNAYYINLNRSRDREIVFLKVHQQYKSNLNIQLHRIPAYDGNNLSLYNDVFIEPGNKDIKINNYEFACSASHIKAILQSYNNNDECSLIIEDDIIPQHYDKWGCTLQEIIKNKPNDAECIQLTCNDKYQIKRLIEMKHKYEQWSSKFVSTGCYYITRCGMEKILNRFYTNRTKHITLPYETYKADCHIIYPNIKSYIYTKPTFTWLPCLYSSTIHPSHDSAHQQCLLYIEDFFKDKNTFIHNSRPKTITLLKKKINNK